MRGAPRSRDDDLYPGGPGALGERNEPVRGAVRGHDPGVVFHPERRKRFRGMTKRRPIGLASHDDGNGLCPHARSSTPAKEAADYRKGLLGGKVKRTQHA